MKVCRSISGGAGAILVTVAALPSDGSRLYLHKPGASTDTDMPIDINNDGTLDTLLGEIRKKGN